MARLFSLRAALLPALAMALAAALAVALLAAAVVAAAPATGPLEPFEALSLKQCRSRCSKCTKCRDSQGEVNGQGSQGDGGGGGGGGGSGGGLPAPSAVDARCRTYMGDSEDDGTCLALVYHHCPENGRTDESAIPSWIRDAKSGAMQQIYDINRDCTAVDTGRRCFSRPPATWSSVCVARPETAGRGKCRKVRADEWRVFVQGEDPSRTSDCMRESSLYIKTHFNGTRADASKTGRVGHG